MKSARSEIEHIWYLSEDGLRLHALRARPHIEERIPVVCLPGISRTAEDFRTLLLALANNSKHSRTAFALDSRGRGLSERDRNPVNYSVPVEVADLTAFLRTAKIERAIFIGTSRGGILTMALVTIMPQAIAGVVLNDVGPVLEMDGLVRIKNYVGKIPKPRSWSESVAILHKIMGAHFPGFAEQDWENYARRTWDERFKPRSDPAISLALKDIDPATPPPALWLQFELLAKAAPIMVLRGEHSDLLSRATVLEMQRRAPHLISMEILGQGHAPILESMKVIQPILQFVSRCDRIGSPG